MIRIELKIVESEGEFEQPYWAVYSGDIIHSSVGTELQRASCYQMQNTQNISWILTPVIHLCHSSLGAIRLVRVVTRNYVELLASAFSHPSASIFMTEVCIEFMVAVPLDKNLNLLEF